MSYIKLKLQNFKLFIKVFITNLQACKIYKHVLPVIH